MFPCDLVADSEIADIFGVPADRVTSTVVDRDENDAPGAICLVQFRGTDNRTNRLLHIWVRRLGLFDETTAPTVSAAPGSTPIVQRRMSGLGDDAVCDGREHDPVRLNAPPSISTRIAVVVGQRLLTSEYGHSESESCDELAEFAAAALPRLRD